LRINFGKKGIPVQEAIHLVKNEIKGLGNINYEMPRAIAVKLQNIAEELKDDPRVLYLDVGTEQYSSFPWKSEKGEMIYTHIKPELKRRVKSIAVREFGGIDHLPDSVSKLKAGLV
jgi:hypothetical protein